MLEDKIQEYLSYCENQKRLDKKTQKAYRIDLHQLEDRLSIQNMEDIRKTDLEAVFAGWHQTLKPKTVKRKVASVKAFFGWLKEQEYLRENPFDRMKVSFKEPKVLPKTIPDHTLEQLLQCVYNEYHGAHKAVRRHLLTEIAVLELLFATGIRISELCSLTPQDINLVEGEVLIHGKGKKERIIQIPDKDLRKLLADYGKDHEEEICCSGMFFVNRRGRPLADQSVRNMILKYCEKAGISQHITPHMFRHTFATSLVDSDVNIRCIQEILGHSSIQTTEIYTHVSAAKQRQILTEHHPRKKLHVTK